MKEIEFAQQFFGIANAITAFVVFQVVALIFALKDAKFSAAFLRWRPYTSFLSQHAGNAYIFAVIVCGITEFSLRWAGGQRWQFLVACAIAVVLRCMAIYWTGSVFVLVFVTICREQDWLNKNLPEREFQTPRVLHTLSKSEKLLHRLAMRVDKRLFGAPLEGVVHAKEFDEPTASPNNTILHRWYDEVWNKGRVEAIDEMLAPDVIGHGLVDLNGNEVRRAEDLKAFFESFRRVFPDIKVIVEDTVSERDKVVALCTVKATHTGEGLAISPTNRVVEFSGMCMVRVKDGKIVEAWNSFDFLSLMQQLGLVSLPTPSASN